MAIQNFKTFLSHTFSQSLSIIVLLIYSAGLNQNIILKQHKAG